MIAIYIDGILEGLFPKVLGVWTIQSNMHGHGNLK